MGQHTRHIVPTRRKERKTVFADARWKMSSADPQAAGARLADDVRQGDYHETVLCDRR